MHRFRDKSQRNSHYLSSLTLLMLCVLMACTFGVLIYLLVEKDQSLGVHVLNCFLGLIVLTFIQRATSGKVRCPQCPMRPMVPSSCQKSSKTSRIFGSYRLKVAFDTVLMNKFRCPYCGESTSCNSKHKSRTKALKVHKHLHTPS